jgi:hypothetical protein
MIDIEKSNKFIDKIKTMTDSKELIWTKTRSCNKEVLYKSLIENDISVVIDSNDRIGIEIPSHGSPIWLNVEEMRLRHLIESVFKSRRMPNHIASWIEDFLKK